MQHKINHVHYSNVNTGSIQAKLNFFLNWLSLPYTIPQTIQTTHRYLERNWITLTRTQFQFYLVTPEKYYAVCVLTVKAAPDINNYS